MAWLGAPSVIRYLLCIQSILTLYCLVVVVLPRDGQRVARDSSDAGSSWCWPGEDGRNCAGPWGQEEIRRVSILNVVEQ